MARYTWTAIVLLCSLGPAWADYIELGTRELVQPDGTRFTVRESADEFGHSLTVKEISPPLDIERYIEKVAARVTSGAVFTFSAMGSNAIANEYNNSNGSTMDSLSAQTEAGKRFVKKVIAGSLSSAIFSYILVDVQESGANLGGLGSLGGVLYGHLFGFPIGVSLVDPYDSFFGTLMGGILGGVGGVGFLYLFAATGRGSDWGAISICTIGRTCWRFTHCFGGMAQASSKSPHLLQFNTQPQGWSLRLCHTLLLNSAKRKVHYAFCDRCAYPVCCPHGSGCRCRNR